MFQYQFGMERKLEWLQNKMSDIGDSLSKVEELFQEFEEFEQQAQVRSQVKAGCQSYCPLYRMILIPSLKLMSELRSDFQSVINQFIIELFTSLAEILCSH